ncbi:MAG: BCD family MFS transporter [Gammaproteobacteria bacterium]
MNSGLGWLGICRLGAIQASLGAIVVLTTSTLNRVMVVELALPALLPGALIALHYAIQILRPRFGHGSDQGGARTPWIIGGMIVLAIGGTLAAASTMVMAHSTAGGIAVATVAFLLVGAGVGASGTSLLVLLAATVSESRRAAAATITWVMMIAGFVLTTVVVGHLLDPFSLSRLVWITTGVGVLAVLVASVAVAGIEKNSTLVASNKQETAEAESPTRGQFMAALQDVMSEPITRRFTVFVFISMLAYSAQDLLLEPFAGAVFSFTPGESTKLGGVQHGGVLLGMILVAVIGSGITKGRHDILRRCMIGGCIASALALATLAFGAYQGVDWPLRQVVFALGLANGIFAVAAIGCMMTLVSQGHKQRDGLRMGVWGAAQAVAFGLGGLLGTGVIDVMRFFVGSNTHAYSAAFTIQATIFVVASVLAATLSSEKARASWSQQTSNSPSSPLSAN